LVFLSVVGGITELVAFLVRLSFEQFSGWRTHVLDVFGKGRQACTKLDEVVERSYNWMDRCFLYSFHVMDGKCWLGSRVG